MGERAKVFEKTYGEGKWFNNGLNDILNWFYNLDSDRIMKSSFNNHKKDFIFSPCMNEIYQMEIGYDALKEWIIPELNKELKMHPEISKLDIGKNTGITYGYLLEGFNGIVQSFEKLHKKLKTKGALPDIISLEWI